MRETRYLNGKKAIDNTNNRKICYFLANRGNQEDIGQVPGFHFLSFYSILDMKGEFGAETNLSTERTAPKIGRYPDR